MRWGSTRTAVTVVAVTAALAVVIPLGVTATTAAWTDAEWVHGEVGTSDIACDTTSGFTATSSGRFLSGELLGTDLDDLAAAEGVRVTVDANGTAVVEPPDALNQGSTPPTSTYTNPLDLSVLDIAGVNLTGLEVGLPVGSAGALNQYAQASGLGDAAGAAGLVSDSGGVLVSQYRQDDTLPDPATVSLTTLLPTVTGVVADPRLEVGAIAASSVLDGCAALRSQLWGIGPAVTAQRDYEIASLDLAVQSALVQQIVMRTNTAVANISTALGGLLGPTGAIAAAVRTRLVLQLGGVAGVTLGSTTGTVTLTGLNIAGAVAPLLSTPLSDGVVTIDLSSGRIAVNLAGLLNGPNGLNDLAPNTELLLNATFANDIADRVDTLLATRIGQITGAITTAVRAATLSINLQTPLNLSVLGAPVRIATPSVVLNAGLGAVMDQTATFAVALNLLPDLPTAVQLVLNGVLGLLNSAVTALVTSLAAPVAAVVTTAVNPLITGVGTSLAAVRTNLVSALGTALAPLPDLLSLAVNVQPDQPGAPDATDYIAESDRATAQYKVTALRLALGQSLVVANFSTASAGPVTAP